jgi:hypothetical protein
MLRTRNILACVAILLAVSQPASAAWVRFTATLNGPSESPPNASLGTGFAVIDFDTVAHTMRVQATFSGLTGTTTASHIHCCTAAAFTGTASVATTSPNFTGFPLGVTFGTYDHLFDMTLASSYNAPFLTANAGDTGLAELALFNGSLAGKDYFNIHSSFVGSGEIRGFLVTAPEPITLSLFGAGLVGMGALRRRLKAKKA